MTEYVAFLRGINITKYKRIKMEDLRRGFEDMGFQNVRTVLASGNMIFESSSRSATTLENKIAKTLPASVGFECDIFVITIDSLRALVYENPFKDNKMTVQIRKYVTFIKGKSRPGLKFPVKTGAFTILGIYGGFVCSFVDLSQGRTPDFMRELDRIWRVNTTRGWNTIERILK